MLQVIADHGMSHQYACWHRLQPMAVQTYGAAIAAVGTVAAAKWFSWLALAALVLLVVEEVQRRSGSRELGLFAGAAVLSCPMLARLSNSLYVDHVMTMLCTAGFVVLFRALRPPCLRGILLSAAIMGSMVQVKYTGLIFGVGVGRLPGGRSAAEVRLASRAAMVGRGRRVARRDGLCPGTSTCIWAREILSIRTWTSWFPSPYWADGFTLQKESSRRTSSWPPASAGVAAFPWTATYHTHSFVEGYDGILGFWALALAPCWFLAWLVRRKGTSLICGTARTASAEISDVAFSVLGHGDCRRCDDRRRRRLHALRAILAARLSAAGRFVRAGGRIVDSLRSAGGRQGAGRRLLSGVAVALLLFLPAPLFCLNVPWDAYAKRISNEEHLRQSFQGYQAIAATQHDSDAGRRRALHAAAPASIWSAGGLMSMAVWWNKVHHIHDRDSFADFCRRNHIRYWMVNHRSPLSRQNIAGHRGRSTGPMQDW